LAGIPPFAGYWSKDAILEAAWGAGTPLGKFAYVVGVAAAFMTAFYSWRLLILTFHGKPRADDRVMAHVHESPAVMTVPLIFLAAGACFAGVTGASYFIGDDMERFWSKAILVLGNHEAIHNAHHVPVTISLLPTIMAAAGIVLAYIMYLFAPGLPGFIARHFRGLYLFLLNKWYFDELYDRIFVKPAFWLGYGMWKGGDGAIIDGVGPDGLAAASRDMARRLSAIQSGYLYHYAFAMLIGVAAFVTWYVARMG
jgi:NADH-quinone oxidoreductase subunit L